MNRKSIVIIVFVVFAIILLAVLLTQPNKNTKEEGISCTHDWQAATCTKAETCKLCDKINSAELGHSWQAATCTTAKTCTRCKQTSGTALGHTTTTGKCTRCNTNFSAWETGAYTDEFGLATSKKYIGTESISGNFSNSAATNRQLNAYLQIDRENIGIMLWEYGSQLVKGTFDYEYYDITILDENGTKHYFTGTIYKSGTRIYFKDADRSKVINLLSRNDELSIYLESTKYSISKYLFTVNCSGFVEAYNGL